MNRKLVGLIIIVILLFLYFLIPGKEMLFEETIILFLLPYLLFLIPFCLFLLIKKLFRKEIIFGKVFFRYVIFSSVFNLMLLLIAVYFSYPDYIEKEQAVEDLDFFVQTLENVHPDLYHNIGREQFHTLVKDSKENLPERITLEEWFKEISKITAVIKDGHTGPDFSFLANSGILFFKKIFPYKIRIIGEGIFVIKNYSYKDDIEPGSEILKINGIAAAEVIKQTSSLLSYENKIFRDVLLTIPFYFGMWNDFGEFEIEYLENSTDEIKTINTFGGIYAKIEFQNEIMESYSEPYYEYELLDDNTGYIKFHRFSNLSRFKDFLKNSFDSMKTSQVNDLIIDIRDNGGGNSSLGDELLKYISDQKFRQFEKVKIKISDEVIKRNKISDKHIDSIGAVFTNENTSEIEPKEKEERFEGRVYLLTGERTFSSAADFTSAFQCYDVGEIIGGETGGLTVCFGDKFHFTLPNSGLRVGVSYKKFYNACGIENNRGVIPDYIIGNSLRDEIRGYDRVLKFALYLVHKNRREGGSLY